MTMTKKFSFIGEIFAYTNKLTDRDEVIEFLRVHKSPSMLKLFEATYHPAVKWALPPGPPPFKPDTSPYNTNPSNLNREANTLYYFLECPAKIANDVKRENAFVQRLESMQKEEAIIMIHLKDGTLPKAYKWLTYELVSEAFPGILPKKAPEAPNRPLDGSGATSATSTPAKRGRGRPKGSGTKNSTRKTTGGK